MPDLFEESMTLVRNAKELLERWRGQLQPKVTDHVAGALIEAGFVLSYQYIESVELLFQHSLGLPAVIIARSQFECSCNMRWASLAADGWIRLRASECHRVVDDHRNAAKHFPLTELPESIRSEAEKINNGSIRKPPRNFNGILYEIAQLQVAEGQQSSGCNDHEFQYDVIYSLLSRAVHGRLIDSTLDVECAMSFASTAMWQGILIFLCATAKAAGESYSPVFQSALPLLSEEAQRVIRERVAERRRSQE